MSLLVICWLLSLATLGGVVVYTRSNTALPLSSGEQPEDWRDFVAIELTRMVGHVSHLFHYARPHGERAMFHSTVLLKKGHDLFIEKIFGRIVVEQGKAASFFLKRIAEHKESLRKKEQA